MNVIVETDRLLLREFIEDDAEAFFAFNSDPHVVRYTGEPPSTSVEEVREKIRAYPDYRRHGFGRWAVIYKPDDRVVGFSGLKYIDELGEVDLGYRLATGYWGRGIATESSRAVVRHGFETLGLERIIGLVLEANTRSVRVLEKVGMTYEDEIDFLGDPTQRWALHRDQWRRLAGSGRW